MPTIQCFETVQGFVAESKVDAQHLPDLQHLPPALRWFQVEGLEDSQAIEQLCQHFQLHPLLIEDILHQNQRPKLDEQDTALFFTLPTFHWNFTEREIQRKQVNLLWQGDLILTFANQDHDPFEPVRQRIRRGRRAHYKQIHSDFLLCALLDVLIDQHLQFLEEVRETLMLLEERLVEHPHPTLLQEIYWLRRQMISVGRVVPAVRTMIGELYEDYVDWFRSETLLYLKDVQDHSQQALEFVRADQEILAGMIDLYLSLMSQKTNDQMRILAVISTIFMPLTLIAGIYGMNFEHMPELGWDFGYPVVIGVMALIGGGIGWFLKHRNWF